MSWFDSSVLIYSSIHKIAHFMWHLHCKCHDWILGFTPHHGNHKALTLSYKWDIITVSARRMVFWNIGKHVRCVSSFCSRFATAVFANCVYPRGQISIRLFYIQSNVIPILPIWTYISTWDRDNCLCLWCCLRCMCGWSKRTVKGIVHFEIKIWYLSAYPKGIQDVGVFFFLQ